MKTRSRAVAAASRWLKGSVSKLVEAYHSWVSDRAMRLGAGLAYYSLFTLVPILFLAISLAGALFGRDVADSRVEDGIADLLGSEAATRVAEAIDTVRADNNAAVLPLLSIAVLLFTASLLFVAWKEMVDLIWGSPRRQGIKGSLARRIFGVAAVAASGVLLAMTIFAEMFFGALERVADNALLDAVLRVTGSAAPAALGALFLVLLFRLTPQEPVPWRAVWPAAVVTMVMLWVGAGAYGIYLGTVGFESASGIAGTLLLGLLVIYYAAQILLYGVELAKVITRRANG